MSSKVADTAQIYKEGLSELRSMVEATEREVIESSGHATLITNNINFFAKSFLISLCAHLEMCVKDLVFTIATDIDRKLGAASIPSSIVEWRMNQKKKADATATQVPQFRIGMTRKEIDDLVSGNVYRTKDALALVGVDLAMSRPAWESWKELIQSIINRRNNIVHHNDNASDLSLGDIRQYISSTSDYIDFIVTTCELASTR